MNNPGYRWTWTISRGTTDGRDDPHDSGRSWPICNLDVEKLRNEDNLYQAGMTSHASVNVMLALEDEFDIEFPEAMLRKSTFESVTAIQAAIGELGES